MTVRLSYKAYPFFALPYMRYYYEKKEKYIVKYGEIYICEHPLFNAATLFKEGDFGLLVVQKRFDPVKKIFFYGPIDPSLNNDIYESTYFNEYFKKHADIFHKGLYPVVGVRKLMWALRLKPLKREFWEDGI